MHNSRFKHKVIGNGNLVLLFSDFLVRGKALHSIYKDGRFIVKTSVDQGVDVCSATISLKEDIEILIDVNEDTNESISKLKEDIHAKLFNGVMEQLGQFIMVTGFNDIYFDLKRIETVEVTDE